MSLELLIIAVLLTLALVPVARRFRSLAGRGTTVLVYLASLGAAFYLKGDIREKEAARTEVARTIPEPKRPGGYVSSDNCRSCHPREYDTWHHSYHRTMTQMPSKDTVRGNFENVTLEFGGEKFHLERKGDEFWVDMVDPDWSYVETLKRHRGIGTVLGAADAPRTKKRISMLTGSHHMQAYWVASKYGNMQFSFPFTYLFHDQRWAPRNDVFLIDPSIPWAQQVWNVNCINCHATGGQPRQDPKTQVIQSRVAEFGISCESCHGPAEEHVKVNADPMRRFAMHGSSKPDPTIWNPARQSAKKMSDACSQCHAIRRNIHKEQWNAEGAHHWPGENMEAKAPLLRYDGADLELPANVKKKALMEGSFWTDGQVRISGRDFTAMSTSGCYTRGELNCLSCHSMHNYEDRAHQLSRGMDGNQACYQCHKEYENKLEQHTHHKAGSSGSLCYNCHMPHTTYGLLKAIRSHTINSPTVQSSLDTGRPNACNSCHLDKPLGWTATKLNEWFKQPVPKLTEEQQNTSAMLVDLLKGDAGQRSLAAWHLGWEPAQEVSGTNWMPRFLAESLVDPYASVRYIAQRSLKTIPGYERISYDYIGTAEHRSQWRQQVLDTWRGQSTATDGALQLRAADPILQDEQVQRLIRQRDNRRMELLE